MGREGGTYSMSKIYSLGELIDSEWEEPPVIVDGYVWEGQNIMFIADAKVGKSILMQQLAINISYGYQFLGKYEIKSPRKVLYVQAEGTIYETADRIKRMTSVVEHNRDNLKWFYTPALPMDREDSVPNFIDKVSQITDDYGNPFEPEVIFFDPLYPMASTGSLTSDDVCTRIANNLNTIKDYYNSTNVLIHHEHRVKRDNKNKKVEEGDDAYFGSYVFKAWPDAVIRLSKVGDGVMDRFRRVLSCHTQRSGKNSISENLFLCQDSTLVFIRDLLPLQVEESLIASINSQDGGKSSEEITKYLNSIKSKEYTKKLNDEEIVEVIKNLQLKGRIKINNQMRYETINEGVVLA